MINLNSESYDVAKSTYLKISRMVIESMVRMVPLVRDGAEIPDSFANTADTAEWKRAEDQIDAAVGRDDLPQVKALCEQYEERAIRYVEAFEAKFREKAGGLYEPATTAQA